MFSTYFKSAFRYLTRNKVTSVINLLGLSLGITCCLIIFLITKHEMSFDTFHPDKERIYRLISERGTQDNKTWRPGMLNPMLEPLRDEITGVETIAITYLYEDKVRVASDQGEKYFETPQYGIDPLEVIITDAAYFDIFRYDWLAGSPASLNEPFKVVLTADKAYKYFGDLLPDAYIGKEITYGNALHVIVAGIVKPWKKNTNFIFTDFISCLSIPGSELKDRFPMESWGMWNYTTQVFMKLLPDVVPATVEAQFPAWAEKYIFLHPNTEFKFALQPLADIHFNINLENDYMQHANLPVIYGLMAIALFILIIAVCNFINLSTAQSLQRTKEIGIRKVLGGKRINLTVQFLGETLLITSFAAILSIFFAGLLIDLFRSYLPQGLSFSLSLWHPLTALFLTTVVLCTTLFAGFYPANILSRVAPLTILKGGTQRGSAKNRLRKSLIVFQFSISLILIICTFVVGNQIYYMMNKDLGFNNKDSIINISIRRGSSDSRELLAEKIKQFPYVEMVSIHTAPPAAQFHSGTRFIHNVNGEEKEIMGSIEFCDEHFIQFYGLRLIAGRNLLSSPYMREFVINETFARQLGYNDPHDAIGQWVISGQTDRIPDQLTPASPRLLQIVGVVSDFHLRPLYDQISPMAISSTAQAGRTLSVKLNPAANKKQIVADMERTWKEINPYERLEMTFYDDAIAAFYEKEQKTIQIISSAMLMAIFISCMGLFGLALFTTKQRTKEIGIRKVLGANVYQLLMILSGGFVKLVLLASLIASPIAWYVMNKWLEDFAYRVPVHGWLFAVACLLALLIALATISLQTLKVARANPVEAIKSE